MSLWRVGLAASPHLTRLGVTPTTSHNDPSPPCRRRMAEFDPYLTWLGIAPTQRPPTLYQLLAIDPAIKDPAVIRALSLQRAAYVRNFQKGEQADCCSRILEEIAQAEATLTDPVKRT